MAVCWAVLAVIDCAPIPLFAIYETHPSSDMGMRMDGESVL